MKSFITILFCLLLVNIGLASDSTVVRKLVRVGIKHRPDFIYKRNPTLKIKTKNGNSYKGKINIFNDSQLAICNIKKNESRIDTIHVDSIRKIAKISLPRKLSGGVLMAGGIAVISAAAYEYSLTSQDFIDFFIYFITINIGLDLEVFGSVFLVNTYKKGKFKIVTQPYNWMQDSDVILFSYF